MNVDDFATYNLQTGYAFPLVGRKRLFSQPRSLQIMTLLFQLCSQGSYTGFVTVQMLHILDGVDDFGNAQFGTWARSTTSKTNTECNKATLI